MHVGKPVRGIRRYQVLFEVSYLGGRRASFIREEHLLRAETSPERPETPNDAIAEQPQEQSQPAPTPDPASDELEQRRAAARERDKQRVEALLALSPHEAARWLARWLITIDVKRGYTEQMIALGHQGYGGSLGEVNVESGRVVRVSRIGPPPSWVAERGYLLAGYDHHEVFSLHALYEELWAQIHAPADAMQLAKPQQMSLWG